MITNRELKAEILFNRYIMNVLLVNVFTLMDTLRDYNKVIGKYITLKDRDKLKKIFTNKDSIAFEYFDLTPQQYERLLNEYGSDVLTKATIIFDGYIKRTGRKPKNVYKKIQEICSNISKEIEVKEKVDNLVKETLNINVESIDTKELAEQYIKCKPEYLRNIDKNCIYLKEKFDL